MIVAKEIVDTLKLSPGDVIWRKNERLVVQYIDDKGQATLSVGTKFERRPLVVLDTGSHRSWRILEPVHDFSRPIIEAGFGGLAERRYEEKCVVNGSLKEALQVVADLEVARAKDDDD